MGKDLILRKNNNIEHYGSDNCDDQWQFWLLFIAVLLISLTLFYCHGRDD